MNSSNLLQIIASSVATGATYALLLFGMLVVYRVSRAVNFSHGALGTVSAITAYTVSTSYGVPIWLGCVLGIAIAAAISFATDRFVLEPVTRRTGREGLDLVVTLGVLLLLTALAEQFFGTTSKSFWALATDSPVTVGGVYLSLNQIVVTIGTFVLLGLFSVFLTRSKFGLSMRAVAADASLASSMGLNVKAVRAITWGFAGALAGVVGIIVASRISVDPYYMQPFLIKAVIAGIIGGLDRFVAPLAAAFAIALFEGFVVYFVGTNYATPALFVLVIVLLATLPKHLLAEKGVVRA